MKKEKKEAMEPVNPISREEYDAEHAEKLGEEHVDEISEMEEALLDENSDMDDAEKIVTLVEEAISENKSMDSSVISEMKEESEYVADDFFSENTESFELQQDDSQEQVEKEETEEVISAGDEESASNEQREKSLSEIDQLLGPDGKPVVFVDRKERKNLYTSDNITTMTGDIQGTVEDTEEYEHHLFLSAFAISKEPLTCVVRYVVQIRDRYLLYLQPLVQGRTEEEKILIEKQGKEYEHFSIGIYTPLEQFMRDSEVTYWQGLSEETKHKYMMFLGNRRTGSYCDVIIDHYDEEGKIAYGNLLRAREKIRKKFFAARRQDGTYLLETGSIVKARITYVTKHTAGVECCGVEKQLRENNLSHVRLVGVDSAFYSGQVVNVKIMQIERGRDKSLDMKFSVKEAYPDYRKEEYYRIPIGSTLNGDVTYIAGDAIYVTLNGFSLECRCYQPEYKVRPNLHDKVLVKVIKKDIITEEDGFKVYRFYGLISRIIRRADW